MTDLEDVIIFTSVVLYSAITMPKVYIQRYCKVDRLE